MSTITAILLPASDGTLHLPVPTTMRQGPVRVEAKLEPAQEIKQKAKAGLWKQFPKSNEFWMASDFDAPLEEFREYME